MPSLQPLYILIIKSTFFNLSTILAQLLFYLPHAFFSPVLSFLPACSAQPSGQSQIQRTPLQQQRSPVCFIPKCSQCSCSIILQNRIIILGKASSQPFVRTANGTAHACAVEASCEHAKSSKSLTMRLGRMQPDVNHLVIKEEKFINSNKDQKYKLFIAITAPEETIISFRRQAAPADLLFETDIDAYYYSRDDSSYPL